jgi:hypothetical protein
VVVSGVPIVLATLGCASSREVVERTFDAASVDRVVVDLAAGDLDLRAASTDEVALVAEIGARAGTRGEAERRRDEVTLDVEVRDGELRVASTGPEHTRVDVALEVPPRTDLEAALADGSARVEGTRGAHRITAGGVTGRDLHGTVDVEATAEGVDLEVFPDGPCAITSRGPLVVSLPYGLEYELVVKPDPEWGAEIADLGFDALVETELLVEGRRGEATLRVELRAVGGPVVVLEATP